MGSLLNEYVTWQEYSIISHDYDKSTKECVKSNNYEKEMLGSANLCKEMVMMWMRLVIRIST